MKSGMLAADAVADALAEDKPAELKAYPKAFEKSWLYTELRRERNLRPAFEKFGLYGFLAYAGFDTMIMRGHAPWTLHLAHPDYDTLRNAKYAPKIDYPKPDGVLTFDRLSSVFLSNTNHEENQPIHLKLRDPSLWLPNNWERFRSPESRYCPAAVYEVVGEEQGDPKLQINAQNCVHCKTCDIKDPMQNIDWATPEGGGGPAYPGGM